MESKNIVVNLLCAILEAILCEKKHDFLVKLTLQHVLLLYYQSWDYLSRIAVTQY